MDRLGLINAFPTPLAFARMSRLAQKRYIEDLIQDLLNEIKAEQRQPDLWERSASATRLIACVTVCCPRPFTKPRLS